ncbi:MAG: ribonuclease H-like domain-containing protein [Clostridia bacterium]|jgi:uncharacterized protein YprB with RNaseH-like and TPR domain|nr:ribonuclease H-like domain-containing protein [Clostridiaceae bacterium]
MDIKKLLDKYQIRPQVKKEDTENTVLDREIDKLVPGKVVNNEHGSYFMTENRYPLTYLYGGVPLGDLLDIDDVSFECLAGNPYLDPRRMLFLDTETTGLSSGTGTVAFLVGVGFLEEDCFVLRQYFMRDYHEEASLLYDLGAILKNAQSVVTYNGKSFDLPLLNARFIANRFRPGFGNPEHLDLLHISRLFWKGVYENCRLCTIEREVLGEIRIEDIPGEQIPLEYFRYLDTKDATVMKKVLSHNESDILTLAALLVRFSRMVKNRFFSEEVVELTGLSKLYEKRENYDSMTECLERRFNLVPDAWDFDSLRRISVIYKRTGRYDKALSLWRYYFEKEDLDTAIGLKVYAGTEIAKYLEHKERDYLSALKTVNELIVFLKSKRIFGQKYLPELDKRKSRLEKLVKRR